MENVGAIVLAAGQGKRMQASKPKVAHTALGKPMIIWSLDCLKHLGVRQIQVVVSPVQTEVQDLIDRYKAKNRELEIGVTFQAQPQGTGHAAKLGFADLWPLLAGAKSDSAESKDVLVVTGDTPLLTSDTLRAFLTHHKRAGFEASLIAFTAANPFGYGRVLCDDLGNFLSIREEKDCSESERLETLCNSGVLCVRAGVMGSLLDQISQNNASKEYYLTDLPALLRLANGKVGVFRSSDAQEFEGVNTQLQLAAASRVLLQRVLHKRLAEGVQFECLETVYVEESVCFGKDVIVEPFVSLRGDIAIPDATRVKSGTGLVR